MISCVPGWGSTRSYWCAAGGMSQSHSFSTRASSDGAGARWWKAMAVSPRAAGLARIVQAMDAHVLRAGQRQTLAAQPFQDRQQQLAAHAADLARAGHVAGADEMDAQRVDVLQLHVRRRGIEHRRVPEEGVQDDLARAL